MTRGRPEILFPLFAELTTLDKVGEKTAKLFEKLHVTRPRDLLLHPPSRLVDRRMRPDLNGVPDGEVATVKVTVAEHRRGRTRAAPHRVLVEDAAQGFTLVFFRLPAARVEAMLPLGETRIVSGKVETWNHMRQMVQPDHVLTEAEAGELPEFEPIYPTTEGLGQRTISAAALSALSRAPDLPEWIDPGLVAAKLWPGWRNAMEALHRPVSDDALRPRSPARERIAYDELLAHQMALALARETQRKGKGRPTVGTGRLVRKALASLPFKPTGAQSRAMKEVAADMAAEARMNRLLQGDVGSGKTLVALAALLTAVEAGGQAALMAPTEILARQHMEGLAPLFEAAGVVPVLLTGRDKGPGRREKLAAIASGEAGVVMGTHALFSADVEFADLRLAVIDEQHRFGVRQRLEISQKGWRPDVLVMTATPIPRSLALASYGDMDVSILDEKPPGRKPVETVLISSGRLEEVVAHLQRAVEAGRQAYWVCPMVEESFESDLTAAEARHRELQAVFGDRAALVHGQMPPSDKDAAMAAFTGGEARVLVATTVIEVGVNVPNASIMVIEHADRFGLAQLHQLRGRVGRGEAASSCLLMYDPPLGETAQARLKILRETEDGFRIAEEDLRLRGAGDVLGTRQSGLPDFRVADLEMHADLMAAAQDDARLLLTRDPTLEGERGRAMRSLLWLMEADEALRLLKVG
ncbi:MAG: ATP-dependent DNA helicase RecG [Albimonas sp.]|uniref:ATP-dependent DNA helicase RecG n=1 Tax=Albimonas sp. TaxID=1872425 RepID=UPI0040568857